MIGEKKSSTPGSGQSKPNQMKLVGQYIIYQERLLGQGQYGKVYEASEQNNTSKRYAVKVIPSQIFQQSVQNTQMLQKEIDVLKKLRHENLVCLHEISQSPNNLYLFLDFCNGGDLAAYIDSKPQKRVSEMEAIELFKQFVAGYQHLYNSKIIHRDVKPENLMLHNGRVKLGDFGFGRFVEGNMNQQSRMSIKCTPIYASPQLLKKDGYSSKCDVWSSGCLLYKMLYGEYPFMAKDMLALIKDIEAKVKGGKEFNFTSGAAQNTLVSEEVKQLIRRMLKYDEVDRISWEELFVHPVLTNKFNIIGGNDELISEQEKSNPIFQSIIQNRNHVLDNDVISDRPQNFQVRNIQKPTPSTQGYDQQLKPNNFPQEDKPNYQKLNDDFSKQQQQQQGGYRTGLDKSPANKETPEGQGISVPKNAEDKDQQYRESLQKFQQADIDQIRVGYVDKMILFLRNQALFADVTMQLVFTARNKYCLPQVIFYELIYSLSGFYNFKLELLKKVLEEQIPPNKIFPPSISNDDFRGYLHSKQGKKTQQKIEKDSVTANSFYKTLAAGILKEVQQQIANTTNVEAVDHLRDFDKFVKNQSANYLDYRNRFIQVAKKALVLLNPDKFEKDINSLRGIRGTQIFILLEEFMPIQQYLTFDFRIFYDQYMNKVDQEKLLKDIKLQKI